MSSTTDNNNTTTTTTDAAIATTTKTKKRWFPLESNPKALNNYISKLGFNTSLYSFVDVFSTDEELLSFIPNGNACVGIIMLYPLTDVQEAYRKKEQEEAAAEASSASGSTSTSTATTQESKKAEKKVGEDNVWFMKQRIGNACGTVGVLHTLANLPPTLQEMTIQPQSWLDNFLKQTSASATSTATSASMSPIARAEILESNDDIEKHHNQNTSDSSLNQTSRGNIDDKVITHFISIIQDEKTGNIYELDGRKESPICHGSCDSRDRFLYEGMKVVKKFMARDPEEVRFTILALVPTVLED